MKFWQRALKSVGRKKGRSFILFLVIFILGNVIAGAVAIEQSTKNVEQETKQKLGPNAIVEMDYERFEKDTQNDAALLEDDTAYLPPKLAEYEAIGQLPYVKHYDLSIPAFVGTNKAKAYVSDDSGMMFGMGFKYSFNVKGVNRADIIDIKDGIIRLDEGQTFTEQAMADGENVVLISKEVAEANHLSVGDSFVLDVTNETFEDWTEEEAEGSEAENLEATEPTRTVKTFDFPVKIAGIFSVIKKTEMNQEDTDQYEWLATEQINTIYAPNNLVKELHRQMEEKIWASEGEGDEEEPETWYQVTYTLKSVDDVEAFREEGNALLSNKYYQVIAATDQYEQIAGGMKKLGTIASYIVLVAALATILIISLMVLLFLRDRKHELGIYLSFGERRSKIIGQIILELLLIGGVACLLSLVTGYFLGNILSDSLLQTDWIANTSEQMGVYYENWLTTNVSYQEVQSAYKVSFSIGYVISYLLLGLGTIVLSALVPLLYILRLNPKKIMM